MQRSVLSRPMRKEEEGYPLSRAPEELDIDRCSRAPPIDRISDASDEKEYADESISSALERSEKEKTHINRLSLFPLVL